MGRMRGFLILTAIAGAALFAARRLGLMDCGEEPDGPSASPGPIEYVAATGGDGSADGGEDHAAE